MDQLPDNILMIQRRQICLMAKLLLVAIVLIHFLYLLHIQPIPRTYHRSPPEHHSNLRISTLNLRVPFPIDIQHNLSWTQRRSSIISAIHNYQPHILAVQEDCYFMNQDMMNLQYGVEKKKLSDIYNRYGLFNRNGESHPSSSWPINAFSSVVGNDGEHNSVYYNKHVYESLDNVTFWLSYTPNVAGSSFDEVTGRIVNCVSRLNNLLILLLPRLVVINIFFLL